MSLSGVALANDNSVEVTLEKGPPQPVPGLPTDADVTGFREDMKTQVAAARARGRAAAARDIKAGLLRIRACGKRKNEREVDPTTGYLLERIGPCDKRPMHLDPETDAYNQKMREWNAKQKKRESYPRT